MSMALLVLGCGGCRNPFTGAVFFSAWSRWTSKLKSQQNALKNLPHQRIRHLLSDLAFIHTYLFKTNSKSEVMSAFCLRRTGMSWEVTVLLHSLHSKHLSESQAVSARLLGNHILSSDTARTCALKSFGEPSPRMKSTCWLFWRPGGFPASSQT